MSKSLGKVLDELCVQPAIERNIMHTGEHVKHCEFCDEIVELVEEESDEDLIKRTKAMLESGGK